MYTREKFGKDLKRRVLERENVKYIGRWAHSMYLDWLDCQDIDFLNLLLTLNTMDLGPEFAFSYEELDQIANDLIANKEVKL